jgi:hypothetical protein
VYDKLRLPGAPPDGGMSVGKICVFADFLIAAA